MSLAIRGMGWVTPLGHDIASVWNTLLQGKEGVAETVSNPISPHSYPAFRVPEIGPTHPRLRRSSAISRFAVAAGLAALTDAGVDFEKDASRTALIFATSNGGVIYTKRFYHDIVAFGAQAASPLLFPETVFNAPASHLAAILGITGASYTLVGDGAVGILAVQMAADIIRDESVDFCLVVAAEEIDWLLCDAYRKWRLLRSAPPIEPFRESPRGMILSEGAGAIVIAREGPIVLERIVAGENFVKRKDAAGLLRNVYAGLEAEGTGNLVASANGTFIDVAEEEAILQEMPAKLVYTMKPALGEGVGAGAIWQIIIAAQILLTGQIPPVLRAPRDCALQIPHARTEIDPSDHALVSTCGLNQQVAGLRLSKRL
jgi:3-oxoacyl-(acyl-carrier-protein) synthase